MAETVIILSYLLLQHLPCTVYVFNVFLLQQQIKKYPSLTKSLENVVVYRLKDILNDKTVRKGAHLFFATKLEILCIIHSLLLLFLTH